MALRPPRRPRCRHRRPRQPGRSLGRAERHARRLARGRHRDTVVFWASMNRLLSILVPVILILIGCGDRQAKSELKQRGIRNDDAALIAAARAGDVELIQLLLRAGRAPDAVEDRTGRTPLMLAAEGGSLRLAQELIRAKANVNARIVPKKVRTDRKRTRLNSSH